MACLKWEICVCMCMCDVVVKCPSVCVERRGEGGGVTTSSMLHLQWDVCIYMYVFGRRVPNRLYVYRWWYVCVLNAGEEVRIAEYSAKGRVGRVGGLEGVSRV